jgi:outer membrane protein
MLVVSGLLLAVAVHAEPDELVRKALALTESGQARQAYDLLEPQEVQRAGDPDFDLVFGIAANQAGEHARAILALERVTIVQPANARARAELGRAMFAVGDSKSARILLQQAKDQGAPGQAALTIDQFLRAIDVAEAQMRSSLKGYAEVAFGRDSNVSSGPANANVAVPNIGGVVLSANAVKRSATFANLAAGVSGRYVVDSRWSLVGNASANKRVNINESFANNRQVNLLGGAAYRLDRQEFTGAVIYEDYNLDGASNRTQSGLVGEWAYRIDNEHEVGAYVQHSWLQYPGNHLRDAHRTVVGGSYAQQLRSDLLAWGGAYVGREAESASGVPYLGHQLLGLRVGVQKTIQDNLSAFAALNHERRRYGGQDPFFLVQRRDNQTTLAVGLNWVPAKSWRVSPQLSLIRNDSSVVVNDYNRTALSISARKEF